MQSIRPVMYLLYSLLFSAGLFLTAPYYLWRHRGQLRRHAWRERLGFLPFAANPGGPGAIWVHCVSVGETLSAVPLVQELRRAFPGRQLFMSHVTPAGRDAGEERLPGVAARFYLPFDWAWTVRRAIKTIRPALLVIVETEIWPNLLRATREDGCRVAIVNARISDRSLPRYLWVQSFMRKILNGVDRFCVQSDADAERFRQLGAPPDRIVVTGNLKFDARPPQANPWALQLKETLARLGRGPVWVAASTMPGEEPLLLDAWRAVRHRHPSALMVLAPRHPARFDQVARLLADSGIKVIRRTSLRMEEPREIESAEVLLLDTMGELAGMFELADVVFMGGTLVATGGHNLIEPAFSGKPIVFGPHMENFRDVAARFLEAGSALQIPNAEALAPALLGLLGNPSEGRNLGARARQVLEQQRGATERTLDQLRPWLEAAPAPCGMSR
jgi:3-deoxy-D-manno-octulosonic-acid transferase